MKIFLSTTAACFILLFTKADNLMQDNNVVNSNIQNQDTVRENIQKENEIIGEIIETKTAPPKEKVEVFSQLTKYGFKNLFTKFGYNPALPYSSQVNPHAEGYMQDYLNDHRNSLIKMKSWGEPYFNLIDNIFSQYGLPHELKYLAVIESNLSTSATSWVGAGGPWQFMPYTAKNYGLVVSRVNDERRDYFKSTNAAARYLLELYRQMHDWLLVIAAYNGGPGRVYEAIRKSGSRDFWTLQYYLPQESRNHVKKFIATHYIMEGLDSKGDVANNTAANFYSPADTLHSLATTGLLSKEELAQSQEQTISGKYKATVIAKNTGVDMNLFNRYNPDFDNRLSANGKYVLVLPAEKMKIFLANKYQILNECVQLLLNDNDIPDKKTSSSSKPVKPLKKN